VEPAGYHEIVTEIAVSPGLDARRLRKDFPVFEETFCGKSLAYLDSANSSQKPRQVLDAMRTFYETSYANVHRAVYTLGERSTAGYEGAREKARAFINASSNREVIFTRNGTEALNLVAYAWGLDNLGPGDIAVATELEHHSNFVPWQYMAGRTGAEFAVIPIDSNGELVLEALAEIEKRGRVKIVASALVSNTLGTVVPVAELAVWAHEQDAIMVVDACQAVPNRPVDVQELGCDFLAFTGHKMLAPSGIGVLWGRHELLQWMAPFELGGSMIRRVTAEKTTWADLPYKYEAGTPPIAEAYGLGQAIDYLNAVGLPAIERYERELTEYALARLAELPYVRVFGPPPERRGGIVSFDVDGAHPHDVAQMLDFEGVAVRAGHHCAQPVMDHFGLSATTRASFYLYNLPEEIDRLIEGLAKARATFA
jgi:cysteine desulfurase/selenocysteine lyase